MLRIVATVVIGLAFVVAVEALETRPLTVAQKVRYEKVTHELIAPCCWREVIAIHRSEEALQMLHEVEQLVLEGRSEEEIKSIYVTRYGPRILADPPGPDWYWLYVIPFALLVSLMLAATIRLRSLVERATVVPSSSPPELLAQVRKETENLL